MNLHNHTIYSDGSFTGEEIVQAAVEAGLKAVAITDHFETKKVDSVSIVKLPDYISHVEALKEKFRDKIKVVCGLEVDTSAVRTNLDSLADNRLRGVDFLLFEYVQDTLWGGLPLWEAVKFRRKISCPVGLAHTDVGKVFAHVPTDELIGMLDSAEIFVELCAGSRNTKFSRPYYHYAPDFFSKISKENVRLSIGTDTHGNLQEVGNIQDALRFIKKNGLEGNLVNPAEWEP